MNKNYYDINEAAACFDVSAGEILAVINKYRFEQPHTVTTDAELFFTEAGLIRLGLYLESEAAAHFRQQLEALAAAHQLLNDFKLPTS